MIAIACSPLVSAAEGGGGGGGGGGTAGKGHHFVGGAGVGAISLVISLAPRVMSRSR